MGRTKVRYEDGNHLTHMSDLSGVHSVLSINRKLSKDELARALRLSIADEYEAIQIYQQMAEGIEDEGMKKVVMDIIGEEQKHASQFWDLLARVVPEEEHIYHEAVKENKEIIGS
jgi:rubrerythrin